MGKAPFVKFDVSPALVKKVLEALTVANTSGKIRKGVNETTKAIERGLAKLVVMAEDVSPPEVLMHLPIICEEKQVPYAYVPTKEELGKASGIDVPTSAVAVTEAGEAGRLVDDIAKQIKAGSKG